MDESKRDTPIDLVRIDTHIISDREFDEIPELTDADFARGVWTPGRQGDGIGGGPDFIDEDIIDRFRATGPGWESRINRILREAAEALGPI